MPSSRRSRLRPWLRAVCFGSGEVEAPGGDRSHHQDRGPSGASTDPRRGAAAKAAPVAGAWPLAEARRPEQRRTSAGGSSAGSLSSDAQCGSSSSAGSSAGSGGSGGARSSNGSSSSSSRVGPSRSSSSRSAPVAVTCRKDGAAAAADSAASPASTTHMGKDAPPLNRFCATVALHSTPNDAAVRSAPSDPDAEPESEPELLLWRQFSLAQYLTAVPPSWRRLVGLFKYTLVARPSNDTSLGLQGWRDGLLARWDLKFPVLTIFDAPGRAAPGEGFTEWSMFDIFKIDLRGLSGWTDYLTSLRRADRWNVKQRTKLFRSFESAGRLTCQVVRLGPGVFRAASARPALSLSPSPSPQSPPQSPPRPAPPAAPQPAAPAERSAASAELTPPAHEDAVLAGSALGGSAADRDPPPPTPPSSPLPLVEVKPVPSPVTGEPLEGSLPVIWDDLEQLQHQEDTQRHHHQQQQQHRSSPPQMQPGVLLPPLSPQPPTQPLPPPTQPPPPQQQQQKQHDEGDEEGQGVQRVSGQVSGAVDEQGVGRVAGPEVVGRVEEGGGKQVAAVAAAVQAAAEREWPREGDLSADAVGLCPEGEQGGRIPQSDQQQVQKRKQKQKQSSKQQQPEQQPQQQPEQQADKQPQHQDGKPPKHGKKRCSSAPGGDPVAAPPQLCFVTPGSVAEAEALLAQLWDLYEQTGTRNGFVECHRGQFERLLREAPGVQAVVVRECRTCQPDGSAAAGGPVVAFGLLLPQRESLQVLYIGMEYDNPVVRQSSCYFQILSVGLQAALAHNEALRRRRAASEAAIVGVGTAKAAGVVATPPLPSAPLGPQVGLIEWLDLGPGRRFVKEHLGAVGHPVSMYTRGIGPIAQLMSRHLLSRYFSPKEYVNDP